MYLADGRNRDIALTYFKPFIEHFRNCSRVLDLASGQGHLLQMFKEAGINAEGIEIDRELCASSRKAGLNVTQGDFFEILPATPPESYDGATASHIIEHFLPTQVEELFAHLHSAVKPGAPFLVLTPNIANMRRAAGDFWRDPSHVRPYPIAAVSKLLRRTGWEVVSFGEHTDRAPSLRRSIIYGIRNALLGRYWGGDDLYIIGRRPR